MQNSKPSFKKKAWSVIIVIFGITMMIIAGVIIPSKNESEEHLALMTLDMASALEAGGAIGSSYSNAKFGGAILIKNIKAATWSPNLLDSYQRILISRGWTRKIERTKERLLLCKNGILARIDLQPSTDASQGTSQLIYGFSMSYSASTLKAC